MTTKIVNATRRRDDWRNEVKSTPMAKKENDQPRLADGPRWIDRWRVRIIVCGKEEGIILCSSNQPHIESPNQLTRRLTLLIGSHDVTPRLCLYRRLCDDWVAIGPMMLLSVPDLLWTDVEDFIWVKVGAERPRDHWIWWMMWIFLSPRKCQPTAGKHAICFWFLFQTLIPTWTSSNCIIAKDLLFPPDFLHVHIIMVPEAGV